MQNLKPSNDESGDSNDDSEFDAFAEELDSNCNGTVAGGGGKGTFDTLLELCRKFENFATLSMPMCNLANAIPIFPEVIFILC